MPERERDNFFALYQRLISKAAQGQIVPPGGLTPSELRDRLRQSGFASPADLERLTSLLERCVYGEAGNEDECRDGASLARRLRSILPEAQPPPPPGILGGLGAWAQRHSALLVPALVAVALALLVAAISRWHGFPSISGARTSPAAVQWTRSYGAEITAAQAASGSWSCQPSNPTYVVCNVDPVLDAAVLEPGISPQLDFETGIDGIYPRVDETFDPPLYWTHRLHVFTTVNSQYQFRQAEWVGHSAMGFADPSARIYSANVEVNFTPGQRAPLPSPAPDAVVIECKSSPSIKVTITRDAAGGLYVASAHRGRVRLRYKLATWSDYSFAPLPEVPFKPAATTLPANVAADARIIIGAIGGLPAPTYGQTIRRLQSYFAGFTVGPIDRTKMAPNMFLTIALQRRGVCRHRARTFFVVATAMGVETRLVENQRHSFCEVRLPDGAWRRIELRLGERDGPPSPKSLSVFTTGTFAFSALVPIVGLSIFALLMLAVVGMRRREDMTGHVVTASMPSDRSLSRARRDRRRGASWLVTADLVRLVRIRLIDRLDLLAQPPHGLQAAFEQLRIPRPIQNRMQHLLELDLRTINPRTEVSELDGCYWDCLRVMYFLERMDQIERSADGS